LATIIEEIVDYSPALVQLLLATLSALSRPSGFSLRWFPSSLCVGALGFDFSILSLRVLGPQLVLGEDAPLQITNVMWTFLILTVIIHVVLLFCVSNLSKQWRVPTFSRSVVLWGLATVAVALPFVFLSEIEIS